MKSCLCKNCNCVLAKPPLRGWVPALSLLPYWHGLAETGPAVMAATFPSRGLAVPSQVDYPIAVFLDKHEVPKRRVFDSILGFAAG